MILESSMSFNDKDELIRNMVEALRNKDNVFAYKALLSLVEVSDKMDKVYEYFDSFVQMLDDSNSYIRKRGLVLIAHNVKWDQLKKIDLAIDKYLLHIDDPKPIVSRSCIKNLVLIAKARVDLIEVIVDALKNAKSDHASSMKQDIQEVLLTIEEIKKLNV